MPRRIQLFEQFHANQPNYDWSKIKDWTKVTRQQLHEICVFYAQLYDSFRADQENWVHAKRGLTEYNIRKDRLVEIEFEESGPNLTYRLKAGQPRKRQSYFGWPSTILMDTGFYESEDFSYTMLWEQEGLEEHRTDGGPADIEKTLNSFELGWYKNGEFHNEHGPALIKDHKGKRTFIYAIEGEYVKPEALDKYKTKHSDIGQDFDKFGMFENMNSLRQNPLDSAAQKGDIDFIESVRQEAPQDFLNRLNDMFYHAVGQGNIQLIQYLKSHGAHADFRKLYRAIQVDNLDLLVELLDDSNITDQSIDNALFGAPKNRTQNFLQNYRTMDPNTRAQVIKNMKTQVGQELGSLGFFD